MHTTQRISIGWTAAALLLAAGLCVPVSGCKGQPKRGAVSSNESVNTGLENIENGDGLALPANSELLARGGDFGSVSDQIAESARQLDVYFANIEIDGVDPTDGDGRDSTSLENEASDSTQEQTSFEIPVESVTQEFAQERTNEPTADGIEDDGSVHVSLLGGGKLSEDQATHQAAQQAAQQEEPTSTPSQLVDTTGDSPIETQDVVARPSVSQDPIVRKEELARELASILTSMAASSDDPGSAALALAGLEMLLPDDTDSLVDEGVLSDAERASLDAARSFLRSMSSQGSIASPGEVASQLEDIQAQLNEWAGLVIKKSALCTRVDGYGRYETFPSYRFIAGQSQPVIVYAELERFGQREFVGPDGQARFETKLSQRLELYHVADDLNTWNRAADTVTDVTRNHLRDYYLINQITLPANLGVGRYHLKVVMRDLIADKVAETIIPIEIVVR